MKSGIDWGHIVLWVTGTVIPALGVGLVVHQGPWTAQALEALVLAALVGGGVTAKALAKRAPKDAKDLASGRLVYITKGADANKPAPRIDGDGG